MALTPRGYPYPALTDAPAGPTQIESLAQSIDTDVQAVVDQRVPDNMCRLARTSLLTVPSGTVTIVDSYNLGALFNIGSHFTNPGSGAIVPDVDCIAEWSCTVQWAITGGGASDHRRLQYATANGVDLTNEDGANDTFVGGGAQPKLKFSNGGIVQLDAGDLLQLQLYQSSGIDIGTGTILFTLKLLALT